MQVSSIDHHWTSLIGILFPSSWSKNAFFAITAEALVQPQMAISTPVQDATEQASSLSSNKYSQACLLRVQWHATSVAGQEGSSNGGVLIAKVNGSWIIRPTILWTSRLVCPKATKLSLRAKQTRALTGKLGTSSWESEARKTREDSEEKSPACIGSKRSVSTRSALLSIYGFNFC